MTERNRSFTTALTQAKTKGYAERNPSFDIKGIDSAHKLAILTLLGFGKSVKLEDIFTEGISRISLSDIRYAKELGYRIKLLAIAKRVKDELEIRVHPTLLPKEHLLSSVSGVFNAVYVRGDMIGEALYYGQGAGQLPAASAVVGDIVDLALKLRDDRLKGIASLVYPSNIKTIRKIEEIETRYYIRFMVIDRPRVLAKISDILGRCGISIASVTQKERKKARVVPIVMMTHEAKERALRKALEEIDRLSVVRGRTVAIRVEEGCHI
jgi:homoserine dehydrogenase